MKLPISSLILVVTFSVWTALVPLAMARGVGGGSRGAGAAGASTAGASTAGASTGPSGSSGAQGFGGYGGHGRGPGFGYAYGRPGTFTGYGDPYGEHRGYAPSRLGAGSVQPGAFVRVVDLQRALKTRGYYAGPVNGRFGANSVSALDRFRRDQGILPADFLDRTTVNALGLGAR